MTKYVPYTNAAGGIDFDHVLPPLHASGEVRPGLLSAMTKDLLAKRIAAQVEQKHPMFLDESDAASAEYVGLKIANTMDIFLQEYFELKDTQPDLRISECGELMAKHLERFQHALPNVDVSALRRTLPTMLEESYNEAKETINIIYVEHAQTRKIA